MSRIALVVGINDYQKSPLESCVNDANDVAEVLREQEYGFNVHLLLNGQATRKAVLAKLDAILTETPCPEFFVFYFAGHGLADDLGAHLVTMDTDDVDVGIEVDRVAKMLNTRLRPEAAALLLLDCCHSGAANVRNLIDLNTSPFRQLRPADLERMPTPLARGRVLIAACKPDEYAYEEPAVGHGLFTYYLLEGLYGDACDDQGKVTVSTLHDYVADRFAEKVNQTPVFRGDMIGSLTLGEGLIARERRYLPEQEVNQIERMAKQLIEENLQIRSDNIDLWNAQLYLKACSSLTETMTWFEKQRGQYPTLLKRPKFNLAYSRVIGRLTELARLEEGMRTRDGVAVQRLGQGTFGVVWQLEAEDGSKLAYKIYHPIDIGNDEKHSRFLRGYRAMEQLDHPHIVRVHNYTRCPIGFTMDYIPGPNLRDFVATRPEPTEVVAQLLTVAETLQHSHLRKVIHRDVKPENIIMSPEGNQYRPYLTDFDLAWFSTATQFTQEALGSFVYAAPEQLAKPNSKQSHSPTTDIYAFGQLLFFFLTRRDPVALMADNPRALAEELRLGWLEKPAKLLMRLYDDCTKDDPSKRVQDFREVCDRLFEVSALVEVQDHVRELSFLDFCRQFMFSIIGLSPERIESETVFKSASGRTRVEMMEGTDNDTLVIFRCESLTKLLVGGADDFKSARITINSRIDTVVNDYAPAVSRRAGQQASFETFIYVRGKHMNVDFVEVCRPIITRVLDAIER